MQVNWDNKGLPPYLGFGAKTATGFALAALPIWAGASQAHHFFRIAGEIRGRGPMGQFHVAVTQGVVYVPRDYCSFCTQHIGTPGATHGAECTLGAQLAAKLPILRTACARARANARNHTHKHGRTCTRTTGMPLKGGHTHARTLM